ncbi:F0F1 ATP synthase subunit B [soil metagenome]
MDLLIPSFGLIIWTFLAFFILLFILKKFAWKPILQSLKDRENGIADALSTAERAKAEIAQFKNENEVMMAKAREERAEMLKEAKVTKDKIVSEAKEQAKVEANKIIADAQEAITNQKMAALTDVKNQVGTLVLDVAEKVLRRELSNKASQESFINELTSTVKFN